MIDTINRHISLHPLPHSEDTEPIKTYPTLTRDNGQDGRSLPPIVHSFRDKPVPPLPLNVRRESVRSVSSKQSEQMLTSSMASTVEVCYQVSKLYAILLAFLDKESHPKDIDSGLRAYEQTP